MEKCVQNSLGQPSVRKKISDNITITMISHGKESPVEPVETEEENIELGRLNSPLQNHLIINHIFKFLEFEDLKQCHLVCSKWNQLSISFLEKMSIVRLGCCPNINVFGHSPKTFNEISQNSDIPFRNFKLAMFEVHDREWSTASVIEFFQDQREKMQELIIDHIRVSGYYWRPIVFSIKNYFDLSPHIDHQLTHLSINNACGSKFIVDISKLSSLKSISLHHCALEISKICVLSPHKFELHHVALVKKGTSVNDFLVNDLLNFENVKELSLGGGETRNSILGITDGASLGLDMKRKVTLDNLSLKSVSLNDFENSQWEVREKLKLRYTPFNTKTRMKFSELDYGPETINLDLLPESLEKLTLNEVDGDDGMSVSLKVVCPPLFSLPNLKYLQLLTSYGDRGDINLDICDYYEDEYSDGSSDDDDDINDQDRSIVQDGEESSSGKHVTDDDEEDIFGSLDDPADNPLMYLNFFIDCPNLSTVKLVTKKGCEEYRYEYNRLQTQWIPKSTENLFLSGNIKVVGQEFNFKKLVIEDNCLKFLMSTLKRLKCKHLVLDLHSKSQKGFLKPRRLERMIWNLIKMPYESLAFGPLQMTVDIAAFKSLFSNYVDENAGYYWFSSQKGSAIKEREFKKMLKN